MLNDETEGVRLNAIKSILKRAAHTVININEERIKSFITVSRDADYEVRTPAYKLFRFVIKKLQLIELLFFFIHFQPVHNFAIFKVIQLQKLTYIDMPFKFFTPTVLLKYNQLMFSLNF